MSSEQTEQATKPRPKKPSGNSHPVVTSVLLATGRTIFVSFPTPSPVICTPPFRALGTSAETTLMDPTARITTPNGDLIGNLEANPPPPFTWSYLFNAPLPQHVPLARVVAGPNERGRVKRGVVPSQCIGAGGHFWPAFSPLPPRGRGVGGEGG